MTDDGPEALPELADRILYHLVDLAGALPLGPGDGIPDGELTARVADALGITQEFAQGDTYYHSQARGPVIAAIAELEHAGLAEAMKVMGPWRVRPTRAGRDRVMQWRQRWKRQRDDRDQKAQLAILEQLERQELADPEGSTSSGRLDTDRLIEDLGFDSDEIGANVQRLLGEGAVAPAADRAERDGRIAITEKGRRRLETATAERRPFREAQEAWVRVAQLQRELELARRNLPALIADDDLRRRCVDLLASSGDYDRVIREACVVLEDRVRAKVGAESKVTGVPLMESAFSPQAGPLQLSPVREEQIGAMQLYRGVMAFFRNAAGHRLSDTYSQDDALRFVAFVDLLLAMVAIEYHVGTVGPGAPRGQ